MARACKERGADDVYAASRMRLFLKRRAKIAASPIKEIVVTDTIFHAQENLPRNCRVISVASLFAKAILSIHRRESVSRLFESEESLF